jgi:hypothetical protein
MSVELLQTKEGTMIKTLLLLSALTWATNAWAVDVKLKTYTHNTYSLEYSAEWEYKTHQTPDGLEMQMFSGPVGKKSVSYCHVTHMPTLAGLNPNAAKMSINQIRDYLLKSSDQELFHLVYPSMLTAQGFRLMKVQPGSLGNSTAAMVSEFEFKIPSGIHYRVQSRYTFGRNGHVSVWCQAAAKNFGDADNAYAENLAKFSQFFSSIKVKL